MHDALYALRCFKKLRWVSIIMALSDRASRLGVSLPEGWPSQQDVASMVFEVGLLLGWVLATMNLRFGEAITDIGQKLSTGQAKGQAALQKVAEEKAAKYRAETDRLIAAGVPIKAARQRAGKAQGVGERTVRRHTSPRLRRTK